MYDDDDSVPCLCFDMMPQMSRNQSLFWYDATDLYCQCAYVSTDTDILLLSALIRNPLISKLRPCTPGQRSRSISCVLVSTRTFNQTSLREGGWASLNFNLAWMEFSSQGKSYKQNNKVANANSFVPTKSLPFYRHSVLIKRSLLIFTSLMHTYFFTHEKIHIIGLS